MSEIISCPGCNARLQVPPESLHLSLKCPQCEHVFRAGASMPGAVTTAQPPRAPEDFNFARAGDLPPAASRPGERRRWADDDEEEDLHFRRPEGPLAGPGRGKAAIILLILYLLVEGVVIIVGAIYHRELTEIFALNLDRIRTLEAVRGGLGLLHTALYLVCAIVFLMWIHSAYANLRVLDARGLNYSPGWAVGYFFIPILNLVRPIQVVQEIWRSSDPDSNDPYASRSRNSVLAGFWWAFWLVSNFVASGFARLTLRADPTIEEIRMEVVIEIIAGVLSGIAGILLIILILAIMKRQETKFQRLAGNEDLPDA